MKKQQLVNLTYWFLALCLIVLASLDLTAKMIPTSPLRKQILGAWIGFDKEATVFYRIVFDEDRGWVGCSYPDKSIVLYKLPKWDLNESCLTAYSTNGSSSQVNIEVKGTATSYKLELSLSPCDKSWNREITFYREQQLQNRISDAQKQMERSVPGGK